MPIFKNIKLISAAAVSLIMINASAEQKKSYSGISIESPSMPTLSAPAIGEGYYIPNTVNSKIYSGPDRKQSEQKQEKKEDDSAEKKSTSILNRISAQDISIMNDLGILGSLSPSGLLYNDNTNAALTEVLKNLDQIKTQNKNLFNQIENSKNYATPAEDLVSVDSSQDSKTTKKAVSQPKILRFSVNSYDILKTCRKIYISSLQDDGSFLVTGDRKYLSDGVSRSETFYLYFKLQKDTTGLSNYAAAALVSQDYLNEYSFLYQLSQKENLTASRTGNLLTMHTNDANWQLDFLIDLGENE